MACFLKLQSRVLCDEALGIGAKHDKNRYATYKISLGSRSMQSVLSHDMLEG